MKKVRPRKSGGGARASEDSSRGAVRATATVRAAKSGPTQAGNNTDGPRDRLSVRPVPNTSHLRHVECGYDLEYTSEFCSRVSQK